MTNTTNIITTREEFVSLPATSFVKVHFNDDSQQDYFVVRSDATDKGASAGGGLGIWGGERWVEIWDNWGETTIELLYKP